MWDILCKSESFVFFFQRSKCNFSALFILFLRYSGEFAKENPHPPPPHFHFPTELFRFSIFGSVGVENTANNAEISTSRIYFLLCTDSLRMRDVWCFSVLVGDCLMNVFFLKSLVLVFFFFFLMYLQAFQETDE